MTANIIFLKTSQSSSRAERYVRSARTVNHDRSETEKLDFQAVDTETRMSNTCGVKSKI